MGAILKPICSCNEPFGDLYLGGGMRDFETVCNAPYSCDNCGKIMEQNILQKNHQCENCKSQLEMMGEIIINNDDKIIAFHPPKYIFDWQIEFGKTYVLENKLYICPKCKTRNLKFINTGCWD